MVYIERLCGFLLARLYNTPSNNYCNSPRELTTYCSYIQKHAVAIVEELVGVLVRSTTCKRSRPTVGLQA